MYLVPHQFWPRSKLEMDNWLKPSLNLFDPFDELDHKMCRNLHWLQITSFMDNFMRPMVPENHRVTLDCAGFNPNSLRTEIKDGKLMISGLEEHGSQELDDYVKREFKKSYKLPENAEADKYIAGQHLVVAIPLKQELNEQDEEMFPRIVDNPNGGKEVSLRCVVPKGIDPSKFARNAI